MPEPMGWGQLEWAQASSGALRLLQAERCCWESELSAVAAQPLPEPLALASAVPQEVSGVFLVQHPPEHPRWDRGGCHILHTKETRPGEDGGRVAVAPARSPGNSPSRAGGGHQTRVLCGCLDLLGIRLAFPTNAPIWNAAQ